MCQALCWFSSFVSRKDTSAFRPKLCCCANLLLSLLAISGASQLLDQLCDLRCGGLWPELNSGPEQEVFGLDRLHLTPEVHSAEGPILRHPAGD